jgi:hypothetical protein
MITWRRAGQTSPPPSPPPARHLKRATACRPWKPLTAHEADVAPEAAGKPRPPPPPPPKDPAPPWLPPSSLQNTKPPGSRSPHMKPMWRSRPRENHPSTFIFWMSWHIWGAWGVLGVGECGEARGGGEAGSVREEELTGGVLRPLPRRQTRRAPAPLPGPRTSTQRPHLTHFSRSMSIAWEDWGVGVGGGGWGVGGGGWGVGGEGRAGVRGWGGGGSAWTWVLPHAEPQGCGGPWTPPWPRPIPAPAHHVVGAEV